HTRSKRDWSSDVCSSDLDTWQMRNGEADAKDVLQRALRYRSYWRGGGGITVSGGEPLLQIDFLLELFEEAKKQGIHTVIDTCGSSEERRVVKENTVQ